jgi:hypothetical protein
MHASGNRVFRRPDFGFGSDYQGSFVPDWNDRTRFRRKLAASLFASSPSKLNAKEERVRTETLRRMSPPLLGVSLRTLSSSAFSLQITYDDLIAFAASNRQPFIGFEQFVIGLIRGVVVGEGFGAFQSSQPSRIEFPKQLGVHRWLIGRPNRFEGSQRRVDLTSQSSRLRSPGRMVKFVEVLSINFRDIHTQG